MVAVFSLAVFTVSSPSTAHRERKVRDVVGMMFSVRDWRALVNLQRLSSVPEHEESVELIDELGNAGQRAG